MVYFPIKGKNTCLLQEKLQNWINNQSHSLRSNISTLARSSKQSNLRAKIRKNLKWKTQNKTFPAGDKKYISLHTLKHKDSTQLKQTEGKFGTEGFGCIIVMLVRY